MPMKHQASIGRNACGLEFRCQDISYRFVQYILEEMNHALVVVERNLKNAMVHLVKCWRESSANE
jgi:hypothetical protein